MKMSISNSMRLIAEETGVRSIVDIPKLNVRFTGTGDLFAALFLAWMAKSNNDITYALETTVSTLHTILIRTMSNSEGRVTV